MFVEIIPASSQHWHCINLLQPVSGETVYDESVQGVIGSVLTEIQSSGPADNILLSHLTESLPTISQSPPIPGLRLKQ